MYALLKSVLSGEWEDITIETSGEALEQQRIDRAFFQPYPDDSEDDSEDEEYNDADNPTGGVEQGRNYFNTGPILNQIFNPQEDEEDNEEGAAIVNNVDDPGVLSQEGMKEF